LTFEFWLLWLSREPSSESVKERFALCVGRRVGIGSGAGVN